MPIKDRPRRLDFPEYSWNTYRGVIYIPGTDKKDKLISPREHNKRAELVAKRVARMFGGNTVQRFAQGSWFDGRRFVREPIIRIEFFSTRKDYHKKDAKVGKMLQQLAKKWGQSEISFEFQSPRRARAIHFVAPRKLEAKRKLRKVG